MSELAASQRLKFKQFSPSQMQVNLKDNLKNTESILPLPMLAVTGVHTQLKTAGGWFNVMSLTLFTLEHT
jgi:hypothetical protein